VWAGRRGSSETVGCKPCSKEIIAGLSHKRSTRSPPRHPTRLIQGGCCGVESVVATGRGSSAKSYSTATRDGSPFVIMLGLSAGIATFGLSQDSAATVIGAMVIAPLAEPITALGGAIALAWPRETLRVFLVAVAGAILVIGIAFLIGVLLPRATPTGQILARTSPDLRDLGVALLAGAAGAYAKTRNELASTLTGVAIAVALVPPLAAVGLMLEEHRLTLAKGAVVLFSANLIGMVLAATAVLLITGYAPFPRLRRSGWKPIAGLAAALAAAVLVAIPLTNTYLRVLDDTSLTSAVDRQVIATLGLQSGVVVDHIAVDGSRVTVDLSGEGAVPPASSFEQDLIDELGPDVTVTINRH